VSAGAAARTHADRYLTESPSGLGTEKLNPTPRLDEHACRPGRKPVLSWGDRTMASPPVKLLPTALRWLMTPAAGQR
jgi:hypothetical protein